MAKTYTVSVIVSGEGFNNADEVAMAVCAGLDWFNEFGSFGQSLEYIGDDEVVD